MDPLFWAGLIWAAFLGMVAGNYATNPIYRLPRHDAIFGRKPYCGDCNAELKPRDLFPILSWLSTRGKCRYCGANVPGEYTLTEAWVMLIFIVNYLEWGFGETFMTVSFGVTGFIMIAMMELIDRFFSWSVLGWVAALGLITCALSQHSIYPALTGAFYSVIVAAAVWKLSPRRGEKLPSYVPLAGAVGLWLGTQPYAYIGFAGAALLVWLASVPFRKLPFSAVVAGALTLLLLANVVMQRLPLGEMH